MSGHRRVVHVIADLRVGGAQRLLLTWAAEAARRGDFVTVVSLSAAEVTLGGQLQALGAELVVLPAGPGGPVGLAAQVLRLSRVVRARRPAVVQTHLTQAHLVGLPAARLVRVPAVATIHSMLVGGDGNSNRALHAETRVLRRLAHCVLACGAVVERLQRERLRPARAVVVPNGVAPVPPVPEAERAALRRELTGSLEAPVLLAVGRLAVGKGYEELMTAFAEVAATVSDVVLVVVGDGPLAPALARLADQLGIAHRVRLLGQRHDVGALMRSADVYVSASHFEGLPLAMLEAMSAGLPIVATEVGDVPTVVDDQVGALVPPRDAGALAEALLVVLADAARRQRLGEGACRRVAEIAGVPEWYDRTLAVHDLAADRAR